MSEAVVSDAEPAGKPKRKLGLVLGLIGALALGGAGFYATRTGLIAPPRFGAAGPAAPWPSSAAAVQAEMPRIVDALNTYLRAVEVRDLEDPAALTRLRAQMLRRVQIVTGAGEVRDLLVTEFVLN